MFWGFFLHVFRKIIFSNQSLTLKNSRSSFIFSSEEFYIVKHFWRNWWTKSSPNKMIYLYTYFKIKHLNHHTKWHSNQKCINHISTKTQACHFIRWLSCHATRIYETICVFSVKGRTMVNYIYLCCLLLTLLKFWIYMYAYTGHGV